MSDKPTENGNPTKNDVIKFIKEKDYKFVSSKILAQDFSKKKKQGRTIIGNRGLTYYIGRNILPELKNDGVLYLVNETAPSVVYGVNHDRLLEMYNSILQPSPQ